MERAPVKRNNLPIKKKKEKRPIGNPSKYESHVQPRLNEIYQWLINGYTDYSIAEQLGIHRATYIDYKAKYIDLTDLYARAIKERNTLVMNRMFSKACGEKIKVDKVKVLSDGEKISYHDEIYIPSDVNAADLYLRNNDPEYRSAKMVEIGGSTTINFNVAELASKREELLTELQKLQAIDVETKQLE